MKQIVFAGIITACFLSACSNTKLISSWKSPDAMPKKFEKVLVFGMMGARDLDLRQNIEQAIAKEMQDLGVNALASSEELGPKALQGLDENAVIKKIRDKGIDAVVMVTLLDKQKEKSYTPGSVSYTPYGAYYSHFWRSYRVMYDRVYTPAYYTNTTNYELAADFYNVVDDVLIYAAQAKTFDPASASALATSFSKTIIEDMRRKDVLTK